MLVVVRFEAKTRERSVIEGLKSAVLSMSRLLKVASMELRIGMELNSSPSDRGFWCSVGRWLKKSSSLSSWASLDYKRGWFIPSKPKVSFLASFSLIP